MSKCPFHNLVNDKRNTSTKEVLVEYRTWGKENVIRPIKVNVPGWAGENKLKENGSEPQPWHCKPFMDASTYGFELIYQFDTAIIVRNDNGNAVFEYKDTGEFDSLVPKEKKIPFSSFVKNHYSLSSCVDIKVSDDYQIRVEPHPSAYTDETNSTPFALCGHIQGWWSRIFFVVMKLPEKDKFHVFEKGKPYAQILIIPNNNKFVLKKMTKEEGAKRQDFDTTTSRKSYLIYKKSWIDINGQKFDNKYLMLYRKYKEMGKESFEEYIHELKFNYGKYTKLLNKMIFKK